MAVKDWSTTAGSNTGILSGLTLDGAVMTPPQVDNAFREMAAQIATQLGKLGFKGADIVSAATTDLSTATGWYVDVTGVVTITAFGTVDAGQMFMLRFTGALTLTHNASSLILPGAANITTVAGDVAFMMSLGSGNWRCVHYLRSAAGPWMTPVKVTPAAVVSSSVTNIPAWVTEIDIIVNGLSLNAAISLSLQLGDAGGMESSGYTCTYGVITPPATVASAVTTSSFLLTSAGSAANSPNGLIQLRRMEAGAAGDLTWTMTYSASDGGNYYFCCGNKATSAVLDRFQIGSANGVATFDAGTYSYKWR